MWAAAGATMIAAGVAEFLLGPLISCKLGKQNQANGDSSVRPPYQH